MQDMKPAHRLRGCSAAWSEGGKKVWDSKKEYFPEVPNVYCRGAICKRFNVLTVEMTYGKSRVI